MRDPAERADVRVPDGCLLRTGPHALQNDRVPVRLVGRTEDAGGAVPVRGLVVHFAAARARVPVRPVQGCFARTPQDALLRVWVPDRHAPAVHARAVDALVVSVVLDGQGGYVALWRAVGGAHLVVVVVREVHLSVLARVHAPLRLRVPVLVRRRDLFAQLADPAAPALRGLLGAPRHALAHVRVPVQLERHRRVHVRAAPAHVVVAVVHQLDVRRRPLRRARAHTLFRLWVEVMLSGVGFGTRVAREYAIPTEPNRRGYVVLHAGVADDAARFATFLLRGDFLFLSNLESAQQKQHLVSDVGKNFSAFSIWNGFSGSFVNLMVYGEAESVCAAFSFGILSLCGNIVTYLRHS